jgi:hypothetical protein
MSKDDIILMADASGLSFYGMGKDRDKFLHYLERFAALVAAAEREACAKVCEEQICACCWTDDAQAAAEHLAERIRARGNT